MRVLSLLLILPMALAQTCSQYGQVSGSSCLCPPGFNPKSGNGTCTLPVCGGSIYQPANAVSDSDGFGNLTSSSCSCSIGWQGPTCTVCESASACTSSLSSYLGSSISDGLNGTMVCSKTPTTYASSQMVCNVDTAIVRTLYPLQSRLSITRTLNASLTPGGASALSLSGLMANDGEVYAQLWYDGVEQFYCQGTDCSQSVVPGDTANGSTWTCNTLNCHCRPGTDFCGRNRNSASQNISAVINVLKGPLSVTCPGANGTCSFTSPFLSGIFGSSGLSLSGCTFGECVQQYVIDQALGITATKNSNGLSGGVIAGLAVVGAILLALVVLLVWGLYRQHKARKAAVAEGVVKKGDGVGISWSGIGYEVKMTRHPWRNILAWIKGSGGLANPSTLSGEYTGKRAKVVLHDAGGQLPPGGFCCILGPSGAGKSTLVDILAGKRKSGRVDGRVAFTSSEKVRVGYVDQSDVLSPTSTVLETLRFAARLRLPEYVAAAAKEQRAREVMDQLGLEDVADTRVGSIDRRGISGGEMRRLSIGIELVASPDVLVLDEPTSGLDSVSAARVVRLLKNLTQGTSPTTIIASIHQPSSALYQAFDQVVLLSQGHQLYFGPGGNSPADYFSANGRPCPAGYNVADHLLEIASSPLDGLSTGSAAVFDSSSDRQSLDDGREKAQIHSGAVLTELPHDPRKEKQSVVRKHSWVPRDSHATTFLTQLEVLSGREWRNLRRDKTLLVAHVLFACIVGVFAGGLYFKVSLTIAGFQNRVGSLFFLGSLIAFSSLSALYNLVEVRGLFLRERAGGFYSPQAWLLSRVIFDVVPLRLFPTILVSIIVYFMVGLARHADRFFKYLLILVEYSLSMTLFNFLLASVFRHSGIAILLSSLCNLFLMTYAGFFVNLSHIPSVLRWLRYFSTLGYTLEALAVNEVGAGLQIIDTLSGVPIQVGAQVIMDTLFGFKLSHYYRNVLILFAFIAGQGLLLIGTVFFLLRERR